MTNYLFLLRDNTKYSVGPLRNKERCVIHSLPVPKIKSYERPFLGTVRPSRTNTIYQGCHNNSFFVPLPLILGLVGAFIFPLRACLPLSCRVTSRKINNQSFWLQPFCVVDKARDTKQQGCLERAQ
jgi:hypothetical protein